MSLNLVYPTEIKNRKNNVETEDIGIEEILKKMQVLKTKHPSFNFGKLISYALKYRDKTKPMIKITNKQWVELLDKAIQ